MATRRAKAIKRTELATTEPVDPREFRKTNEAIGLRVTEGRLSLLTRKLLNVMMFHAQELKTPGLNAPIDTPASKKYFWIPLNHVARDAAYNSGDTAFLKQTLEELQNIKVLMENERQWTSERVVASVTLVNPKGLKKHAGQVWFGYAFPPEVHELVLAPGTYTRFSIFYQGLLRSGAALALYEVCRRYATNPSKLTMSGPFEYWYGVLTGNPAGTDDLPEYKYFKRDTIKPAIAEINTLTDIQVELIEHKNGRKVERIQFRVEQAKQPQLNFGAPPVIDLELLGRVMKFGFNQQDASDILAQHGDDKVRAAVAVVEARLAQRNSAPLDSPAGYFRWALKQGVNQLPAPDKAKDVKAPALRRPEGASVMERFLAARAQDALSLFREMSAEEQQRTLERFKAQNKSRTVKPELGIANPIVRAALGPWYAQELWGEPTAQALASFVEQADMGGR